VDIQQHPIVHAVGDELDAADVHTLEAVEPQHSGRQLAAEVGRDENDSSPRLRNAAAEIRW